MTDSEAPSQEYTLSEPVDFTATLDQLFSDSLGVTEQRMFVIFGEAILDLRSSGAPLTNTTHVKLLLTEAPPGAKATEETATDLFEQFLNTIADVTDISYTPGT